MIEAKAPMFEFMIDRRIAGYDLATVEGRVGALRSAAPIVAEIRDRLLRPGYERVLARLHEAGLRAWLPAEQGCGDAGLALGQAWVAAQQLGLAAPATDRPTTMTTTTKEHETCA